MNPDPTPAATSAAPDRSSRFAAMSLVLVGGLTLALGTMLARVAQLQLRPSEALQEHVEPRITRRAELPLRGDILDKKGRLLSATRFGQRVIVDPTLLPEDVDTAISKLADATGQSQEAVGEKIIRALAENQKRAAAAGPAKPLPEFVGPLPLIKSKFASLLDKPSAEGPAVSLVSTDDVTIIETQKDPIRYMAVSELLTDEQARAVRALKIAGVSLEKKQVREYPGGPEIAPIVGKVSYEHEGIMGAEKLLNQALEGDKGHVDFVRDARGHPVWLESGGIQPAKAGEDIKLSLDLEVQRMATEELQKGIEDSDAAGGRCMVVDPITGEVLAMVDIVREPADAEPFPWADDPTAELKKQLEGQPKTYDRRGRAITPKLSVPPAGPFPSGHHRWVVNIPDPNRKIHPALARNRCVEDCYEPGSTFKPYVWATVTELGLARPDEVFDTHNGTWVTPDGRTIKDVHTAPTMTWATVLVNSSNIGMIQGAHRLSYQQLHDAVERFGFGRPMGLGLPGEAAGIVTPMARWGKATQTSVAFGNEVAVTPIQMARAFCAFARPGESAGTLPRLHITALSENDPPGVTYRVLPASIAKLTRETMVAVGTAMEAKYCKPPPGQQWRYTMFGKSGTAKIPTGHAPEGKRPYRGMPGYLEQYRSSFVAGGPTEDPRLVVLVVMDDPGPSVIAARRHYGAASAGPVVRRVMERTLAYMGVNPSPREALAEPAN